MMALAAFVPDGKFPTESEDDWNRLGLLVMVASKTVSIFVRDIWKAGHSDSLDDLSVYSQMLNEIDYEIRMETKPAISSTDLLKNLDTPEIDGAIQPARRHS